MNTPFRLHQKGDAVYLTSPLLDKAGAKHFFATRKGGVSKGVFGGWNFASGVGKITDTEENVLENYRLAAELFGLSLSDICRSYQAHTSKCITVDDAHRGVGTTRPKFDFGVDGLVSKTKDLLLSVRTADCVPILLFDPQKQVCAAIHAGWRGTALGVAGKTAREMVRQFGCDPKNIRAAIGPNIGFCCFETDRDVPDAMLAALGEEAKPFIKPNGEKYYVNLKEINALWLRKAGVEHIEISDACTVCQSDMYWSHRVTRGERGSQGAIIVCKEACR